MSPEVLEPIADAAWPARERERLGGWRLNATDGFSLRINACWPLGEPDRDPEAAIDAVEAFYGQRGLPVRFKLTDGATAPADLADRLTELLQRARRDAGRQPIDERFHPFEMNPQLGIDLRGAVCHRTQEMRRPQTRRGMGDERVVAPPRRLRRTARK